MAHYVQLQPITNVQTAHKKSAPIDTMDHYVRCPLHTMWPAQTFQMVNGGGHQMPLDNDLFQEASLLGFYSTLGCYACLIFLIIKQKLRDGKHRVEPRPRARPFFGQRLANNTSSGRRFTSRTMKVQRNTNHAGCKAKFTKRFARLSGTSVWFATSSASIRIARFMHCNWQFYSTRGSSAGIRKLQRQPVYWRHGDAKPRALFCRG